MPQIAQLAETYSSQIFWVLVFFGLVFFIVGRGMLPKVTGTVAKRNDQIAADLEAARKARDEADNQEEAWRKRENANREQAQSMIAEAKAEAAAEAEKKLSAAQLGLDEQLSAAENDIGQARDKAMGDVAALAGESARAIVKRLAGIEVSEAQADAAVKQVMDQKAVSNG